MRNNSKDKSIVTIFRNNNNDIYKIVAQNHTQSIVCAALSILTLNTINSIEEFTDEEFDVKLDEESGFIDFSLPLIKDGKTNKDVNLLLNSFLLGVKGIEAEYNKSLNVIDGGAI